MTKIKKFNEGDEVKVTQLPYMGKPPTPPENEFSEMNRAFDEQRAKARLEKDSLAPYEKRSRGLSKSGGGGGGALHGVKSLTGNLNFDMKKGGKVKSASERADGCCIRGKTRA
jgi:hypothetical protein